MGYTPPTSMDEYNRRYVANTRIDGHGMGVAQHLACPFCAGPDFMTLRPVDMAMRNNLTLEETCKYCRRSLRAVFVRTGEGSEMRFEQTGGDDPPEWLQPPPPDARQPAD